MWPWRFHKICISQCRFNVATLTGHNTFHAMGGIACVTPPALKSVHIEPPRASDNNRLRLSAFNLVWMLEYLLTLTPCLPWSGFMKTAMKNYEFQSSGIETLQFIRLDISNPSTIHTALCFAQAQSEKHNLSICPVTFAQKATEIVAASRNLDKLVVRLGGFHMLISYLDSIWHIMNGSGLADLWERLYARGLVVHNANRSCLFSSSACPYSDLARPSTCTFRRCRLGKQYWQRLYDQSDQDTVKQDQHSYTVDNEILQHFEQLLVHGLDKAATGSRTGKLWVQYVYQVLLMLKFITAEQTGNWQLHLHFMEEMIPHFHAAGQLQYAKSARLYLQQMNNLVHVMSPEEYTLFSDKGYFTSRIFGLAIFLTRPSSSTLWECWKPVVEWHMVEG